MKLTNDYGQVIYFNPHRVESIIGDEQGTTVRTGSSYVGVKESPAVAYAQLEAELRLNVLSTVNYRDVE